MDPLRMNTADKEGAGLCARQDRRKLRITQTAAGSPAANNAGALERSR
jgi:hypothetical protein